MVFSQPSVPPPVSPGFMLDKCPLSCPAGCNHPIEPPGPKASAVIRDAWEREDLGAFVGRCVGFALIQI